MGTDTAPPPIKEQWLRILDDGTVEYFDKSVLSVDTIRLNCPGCHRIRHILHDMRGQAYILCDHCHRAEMLIPVKRNGEKSNE